MVRLGQILRHIDEKIDSHNRSEVDIKSADREIRTSLIRGWRFSS